MTLDEVTKYIGEALDYAQATPIEVPDPREGELLFKLAGLTYKVKVSRVYGYQVYRGDQFVLETHDYPSVRDAALKLVDDGLKDVKILDFVGNVIYTSSR